MQSCAGLAFQRLNCSLFLRSFPHGDERALPVTLNHECVCFIINPIWATGAFLGIREIRNSKCSVHLSDTHHDLGALCRLVLATLNSFENTRSPFLTHFSDDLATSAPRALSALNSFSRLSTPLTLFQGMCFVFLALLSFRASAVTYFAFCVKSFLGVPHKVGHVVDA